MKERIFNAADLSHSFKSSIKLIKTEQEYNIAAFSLQNLNHCCCRRRNLANCYCTYCDCIGEESRNRKRRRNSPTVGYLIEIHPMSWRGKCRNESTARSSCTSGKAWHRREEIATVGYSWLPHEGSRLWIASENSNSHFSKLNAIAVPVFLSISELVLVVDWTLGSPKVEKMWVSLMNHRWKIRFFEFEKIFKKKPLNNSRKDEN